MILPLTVTDSAHQMSLNHQSTFTCHTLNSPNPACSQFLPLHTHTHTLAPPRWTSSRSGLPIFSLLLDLSLPFSSVHTGVLNRTGLPLPTISFQCCLCLFSSTSVVVLNIYIFFSPYVSTINYPPSPHPSTLIHLMCHVRCCCSFFMIHLSVPACLDFPEQ